MVGKKGKRGSTVPPDETKQARFSRLASQRVAKAVKQIKNIGNLSGSGYEYTEEQVKAISNFIKSAHDEAMSRFRDKGKAPEQEIHI